MKYESTQTPDSVDVSARRERYRRERDRRLPSDLRERWGLHPIGGRDGLSLYDHWRDGRRALHGVTTHSFPNLFFIHFSQGGVHSSILPASTSKRDYIITKALRRGATMERLLVEP